MSQLAAKRDQLLYILGEMRRVAVALSGGVDSSLVVSAAFRALGDRAIAVTADSPSVARSDLEDAIRIARQIGIAHRVIQTREFANPNYARNDGSRCYFCKDELYSQIEAIRDELGDVVVVSGANLDDRGDYRPGLTAAAEHGVRHPLQEAGFTKADVRALARDWNLDVADKPASPCLSSRIAPGVAATAERVARIEVAEAILRGLGIADCRVRLHDGELARIELPVQHVQRFLTTRAYEFVAAKLRDLGFQFVTLDLEGLRSGSLNNLIALETRKRYSQSPEAAP